MEEFIWSFGLFSVLVVVGSIGLVVLALGMVVASTHHAREVQLRDPWDKSDKPDPWNN